MLKKISACGVGATTHDHIGPFLATSVGVSTFRALLFTLGLRLANPASPTRAPAHLSRAGLARRAPAAVADHTNSRPRMTQAPGRRRISATAEAAHRKRN